MSGHPSDDELLEVPTPPRVESHLASCARCRLNRRMFGGEDAELPADVPAAQPVEERFVARLSLGVGPRGPVESRWDRVAGRRVAYKHVTDGFDVERLSAWRGAANRIGSPYLVVPQVLVADEAFTRELATGRSLVELDPATDRRSSVWFGQAAAALVALHDAGLVHGGVRAANLWVRPDGSLRVVDGGLDAGTPDGDLAALARIFAEVPSLAGICERIVREGLSGARLLALVIALRDAVAPGAQRYHPKGLLGVGGMGEVHRVYDPVLERVIAQKSMCAAVLASGRGIERFLAEARLTSQLQHPGIVPVHEMAQHDDGTVTFTMKEIRGRTLSDLIRGVHGGEPEGWTVERLVGALYQACETVAYAHAQGVIHRDLKPMNVMIGDFGEVLVVDWGLASRVGAAPLPAGDGVPAPLQPGASLEALAGTSAYMAPELHRREPASCATDLYALGACLCEIASGLPPRQDDPASALPVDVPVALAAIAHKATHADAAARYADAEALAKDLEAWRSGLSVSAYRESAWERFRRATRPYDGLFGVAALALVVVVAIVLVSQVRVEASERAANASLGKTMVERAELAGVAGELVRARLLAAGAVSVTDRADARGLLARLARRWDPVRLEVWARARCRSVFATDGGVACVEPASTTAYALGEVEAPYAGPVARSEVATLADTVAIDGTVASVVACGPGRVLIATTEGRLFTRSGDGPLIDLQADAIDAVIACESDGARFAVAAAEDVQVWRTDPPLEIEVLEGHHNPVQQLAWSSNGLLATASAEGTVRVWRPENRDGPQEIGRLPFHEGLTAMTFDDDDHLWTSSRFGLAAWEIPAVERASLIDTVVDVAHVAWGGNDGLWVVNPQGIAQRFVAETGAPQRPLPPMAAVAPSLDGRRLFAVNGMGTLALFEVSEGGSVDLQNPVWQLPGAHLGARHAVLGPRVAATADALGDVRLWDLSAVSAVPKSTARLAEPVRGLALSRDGSRLVALGRATAHVLDGATLAEVRSINVEATAGALDSEGRRWFAALELGGLEVFDVASGGHRSLPAGDRFVALDVSPDDAMIAAVTADGVLQVFDASTGVEIGRLFSHANGASDVAFSPLGDLLVSAGVRGDVQLLSTAAFRASRLELEPALQQRYGAARSETDLMGAP